jgi:hypothetical protein
MNKVIIPLFFLMFSTFATAKNDSVLIKVPKQYSFEFGYRNLFSQSQNFIDQFSNHSTHGYGMLLDYAWKLSGLNGKRPGVYLTVPLGYTVMMPDDPASKSVHMLNYGWTVRHELSVNKLITPFVAYGLLLNNMRVTDTEGSVFGHQTQFEFGLNFNTKTRLKYFAKIQYSYTSYPQFNQAERFRLHYADLRIGVRF